MTAIYSLEWRVPDIMRRYAAAAFLISLALLITFSVIAVPSGAGGIAGRVLDAQGQPVPYATVVAREVIRAQVIRADAQADGSYLLAGVLPGTYALLASAHGYKTRFLGKVSVSARHQVRVEVVLER